VQTDAATKLTQAWHAEFLMVAQMMVLDLLWLCELGRSQLFAWMLTWEVLGATVSPICVLSSSLNLSLRGFFVYDVQLPCDRSDPQ